MATRPEKHDFDDILRRTQSRIRAYIAGMGIAAHEVDDVAQDVYVELYRGLDRIPNDVEPERWLKGIARNICLNHIRRRARRGRLHYEAIAEILARTETPTERSLDDGTLLDALGSCVDKLPPKSRQIVSLRYQQDLPSHEIADLLKSTAQAIRVALFRIRNGLKDCIAESLARETGP